MHNIEPGSLIATDSWRSYDRILNEQYSHDKTQGTTKTNEKLYGVHLVASLVKRLIRGTYQGRFEPKYLQNYLDEYVFRFNRRKSKSIGKIFMRIVQLVVQSAKVNYKDIPWDIDPISEYFAT